MAPAPPEVLVKVFGTRQPTVAAVERAVADNKITNIGRDHGAYLIAYACDKPDAMYFIESHRVC